MLVGFGGLAQTGKGTAARMLRSLARKDGLIALPLAYAWPMKIRTSVLNFFTLEEMLKKPPHVRTAFQVEGTERGRDVYGEDFWVNHLKYLHALMLDEEPEAALFTVVDARFPNELEYIRSTGGSTIWIQSDRGTLAGSQATHASETSVTLQDFDYTVTNNKDTSLDDLYDQIEEIYALLIAR